MVELGDVAKPAAGLEAPRNILLIGTDDAAGLDKKDPARRGRQSGGQLADVIMILRIDPATNGASLLSIPRDTWVPVAPRWSNAKINSSFSAGGGPTSLIATIKHAFGISIDNYAQVDFAGFRGVVDVLGGVPVFLDRPVSDPTTGLWLPQTGCIVIDPPQALAYARSRHFRYQDSDTYKKGAKWRTDSTGDLGRISRQQDFLQAVAQRAISKGIRNPATAVGLVNAGIESVQIDETMNVKQIIDLIQLFRNFSVDELQRFQLPTTSGGNSRNSYQEVIGEEAEGMLDVFRGVNDEGPVDPATVLVDLASGADPGLVTELEGRGFDADLPLEGERDDAPATSAATTIRFGLRGVESARLLATQLSGEVRFEYQKDLPGRRLRLLAGPDGVPLETTPKALNEIPMPTFPKPRGNSTTTTTTTTTTASTSTTVVGDGAPTSTIGDGESSTTTIPDVTTTTALGIVPLDATAAARCG